MKTPKMAMHYFSALKTHAPLVSSFGSQSYTVLTSMHLVCSRALKYMTVNSAILTCDGIGKLGCL